MFDSFWRRDSMNLNMLMLLTQRVIVVCDILSRPLLQCCILLSTGQITFGTTEDRACSLHVAGISWSAISFKAADERLREFDIKNKNNQNFKWNKGNEQTLEGKDFDWYLSVNGQAHKEYVAWTSKDPYHFRTRTCRNLERKIHTHKNSSHEQPWSPSSRHSKAWRILRGCNKHSTCEKIVYKEHILYRPLCKKIGLE